MTLLVGLVEVVFLCFVLYIINLINPNVIPNFIQFSFEIKNEVLN